MIEESGDKVDGINERKTRKRQVLAEKIKALDKRWEMEYQYTYYYTYLNKANKDKEENEEENKEWKKIQNDYREIVGMHWEDDAEHLKLYQAEALCKLGILYMEKGDLDRACESLEEAGNIMENFSLQYVIPEYYVWAYIYMARAYTEKHRDLVNIEQYCKKAGEALEYLFAPKSSDKDSDKNSDKDSDTETGKVSVIARKLKVELILLWVIIRSNAYKREKDTDFIKEEPQIEKYLGDAWEDIQKIEEEYMQEKKDRRDNWIELWLRKQRDTYWASKGVYYKWLCFIYKDNTHFRDSRRNRNRCFGIAVDSFLEGMRADENNTICAGNIAALLYNYRMIETKTYSDSVEDRDFLQKLLCKITEQYGIEGAPGDGKCITYFLDKVFAVDQNNMFALNLEAMLSRNRKDETYPYLALRQSSLRRRFTEMDRQISLASNDCDRADGLRQIKEHIINLHAEVANYMNEAIYPRKKFAGLIVGHYTKSNVLPKLLRWEGNSRLRIRNAKHLNDPSEGALFMGYINRQIDNSIPQISSKKGGGDGEGLIRSLLQIYEYKRREEWNQKSSVYMGCFSSRIDQLNMWSRYGDAGKGCCLCIDAGASFDESTAVPLAEISTVEDVYRYKMEDNQYPPYMVVYLPGNTEMDLNIVKEYARGREGAERKKSKYLHELCKKGENEGKITEKIGKEEKRCLEEANWWSEQAKLVDKFETLIENLSDFLTQIQNDYKAFVTAMTEKEMKGGAFAKLEEEIINTIMMILDQVRFLVKDDAYRDEREYRVIQYSYEPEYEESDEAIPKLYVNIEKELQYKTVVFGPLTQNYASDSAYVLNLRKKTEDRKEGESPKLNVYKSEIPYCL